MTEWNEADHPRDEEGKFTYKNRGQQSREDKIQNRADILYGKDEEYNKKYESKKDTYKINKSNIKNKIIQKSAEKALGGLYNYIGYPYAKNTYGEDTVGMIDLAHENPRNPNYTKNTIELNSYEKIENVSDRDYLKQKITEQYSDYGYNSKEIKGRIFPNNSESSQRIAQDKDFLLTIKNNKEKILNHNMVSGYFPRYKDNKASNWHFAIGHYDLRNGYLDQKGNLHIQMFDTYDFNKDNHTPLNQAGRNQMMKGTLIPYFTIHNILIPANVMKNIW